MTVVASLEANQSRKELDDFVNVVGSITRDKLNGHPLVRQASMLLPLCLLPVAQKLYTNLV